MLSKNNLQKNILIPPPSENTNEFLEKIIMLRWTVGPVKTKLLSFERVQGKVFGSFSEAGWPLTIDMGGREKEKEDNEDNGKDKCAASYEGKKKPNILRIIESLLWRIYIWTKKRKKKGTK